MGESLVDMGLSEEELRALAALPPPYLADMRSIYEGVQPQTAGQQHLYKLLTTKPNDFMSQWRSAEREYRAQFAKKAAEEQNTSVEGGTEGVSGTMPVVGQDEAVERVEELIQRLLGEATRDG